MHIGVISPEFPPEVGGVETYAYEFARELAGRGVTVTVFTRPHSAGEISPIGIKIAPVLTLKQKQDREILRNLGVDAWHVMNASYSWVARETDAPVVISVHGYDFLRPYYPVAQPDLRRVPGLWRSIRWRPALEQLAGRWLTRALVRRSLPRATHILANSRYTERVLLESNPACRGITSTAWVGVSPEYLGFTSARSFIGHTDLITVCRLADPRKNVDLVLRALASLTDRHRFSYTVVGDGPLRPELERLVPELGLQDRVRFKGFVDSASLRTLLGQSDLFVLTSSIVRGSHEGFGIAYLEANACGTPVLASRLAGASEAVEEGISGYFVDEPSTEAVAAALDTFFSRKVTFDPAACHTFASQFTWRRVVDHAVPYYSGRA